jgi:hypothetical protein
LGRPGRTRIAQDDRTGDLKNEIKIDAAQVQIGSMDSVTYSGQTTLAEARALGAALQSSGFFKGRGTTVGLAKHGSQPEISFYLRDGAEQNPQIIQAFEMLGRRLAPTVGGPPITIHLIDNEGQSTKDLAIP